MYMYTEQRYFRSGLRLNVDNRVRRASDFLLFFFFNSDPPPLPPWPLKFYPMYCSIIRPLIALPRSWFKVNISDKVGADFSVRRLKECMCIYI